jgi:hypothetical protein
MHTHGSSCLQGPVIKDRPWWRAAPRPTTVRAESDPIRRPLVERVRREIAAGAYDTPEKFEAALGRLLAYLDD